MGKKLALMVFSIALLLPQALRAEDVHSEKRADIRKLVELTGMAGMVRQMMGTMAEQFVSTLRRRSPDIPEGAIVIVRKDTEEVMSSHIEGPGGLVDRVVPIYDKYFTGEELKGLIAFYQSPLGRKVIAAMPLLMQESMAAGREWGKGLAPLLLQRIRADLEQGGYIKRKPSPRPGTVGPDTV